MSLDAIKQILKKAGIDLEYRKLLISDPDVAMMGHDLTPEEQDLLRGITVDTLEAKVQELGERVSRARVKVKLPWDPGDLPSPPQN